MKSKTTAIMLLIILLMQIIIPSKLYAADSTMELYAGIVAEPTVEFLALVGDSIMTCITSFMLQTKIKFVMVSTSGAISKTIKDGTGVTYTIDDLSNYNKIKYPNFTYTPEEIFAGKVDMLDANFMNSENTNKSWNALRSAIAQWYKVLRMIAIVALLSLLIFTGIKIILVATSKEKAKYKEFLINWLVACILVFTMQYIMAFIMNVTEEITSLLYASGTFNVIAGTKGSFNTNLMGLARFQMQQRLFTTQVVYLTIYIALIVYTVKFTIVYFKRMLTIAFLTMISPIVAVMYPIDKLDGKATNFGTWLKEYTFNALLQPVHYLLFKILISSSISLAASNPIFALVALASISQGEKIMKKIFGFDKAKGGTVGGLMQTMAGAAVGSTISNMLTKTKNKKHNYDSNVENSTNEEGYGNYLEKEVSNSGLNEYFNENEANSNNNLNQTLEQNSNNSELTQEDATLDSLASYRNSLENKDLGTMDFNDGDAGSMFDLFDRYSALQSDKYNLNNTSEHQSQINNDIAQTENLMRNRVEANELLFSNNGIMPQYVDGIDMTSSELLNYAMENERKANSSVYSPEQRMYFRDKAQNAMEILNRRMLENQYISQQIEEPKDINETPIREMKPSGFKNGMKALGKKALSPIWDMDKSAKYNGKRLTRKIAGAAVGSAVGLATGGIVGGIAGGVAGTKYGVSGIAKGTASVVVGGATTMIQAGISMADGKYNPLEGVATFATATASTAAMVSRAGSRLSKTTKEISNTYKNAVDQGDEKAQLERYSKEWFNRDDVVQKYETEFPGTGKEMRKRAAENLVSRGITDFNEQKQILKCSELMIKERGLTQEEADKVSVATFQYKKNLQGTSNYGILFNEKQRNEYLNIQAENYKGKASKESVKKLHNDFIQNVRDFDRANR